MTTVYQGLSANLEVAWSSSGQPLNVFNQSVTVSAATGGTVPGFPASSGIVHQVPGLYSYVWAVPATQAPGDYTVTWNASTAASGGSPLVTSTSIIVAPSSPFLMQTWCDISLPQTLALNGPILPVDPLAWTQAVTGVSVTAAQVALAQQMLNPHTNYTPELSGANMQPQDLIWLRYALAYQAVWMTGQPGLLVRSAVTDVSQDGVAAKYVDESALTLGPLARRAIKQLSWKKSRSLRVRTPFIDDQTPLSSDPDSEANDLYERWVDFYDFGGRSSTVP
jgi:hypothetical protein